MRHVIFARPIATCSCCMIVAAAAAHLVTAAGFALRLSACFLSASFSAISVATITMAADQNLDPAAPAQEQPRRRSNGLVLALPACVLSRRLVPWMQSLSGTMMPLHSCSCTVKGTASMRNCGVGIGVVPACQLRQVLSRQPMACQASRRVKGRQNSHLPQAIAAFGSIRPFVGSLVAATALE
jgi:hypothetical protein